MSVSIQERIGSPLEQQRALLDIISSQIRVAMPGIIESFDAGTQTATVRLAIREGIKNKNTGMIEDIEIPLLLDVPVQTPRGGGFCITLPVQRGDECLVVFADTCIDAWWANGGVQNQEERRRHDLSDAFAIVGVTSQPRRVSNYPLGKMTLQAETGSSLIEIEANNINIKAENISLSAAKTISISAPNNPDGVVDIVGWTAEITELKP